MFNIINNDHNKLDHNNCIFSRSQSRPSKSLIDPELYKQFIKLDLTLDIINEYSYLKKNSKPIEFFLLHEIINKLKIFKDFLESFALSFDTIVVNEVNNVNVIFCIDTNIVFKQLIENIISLFKIIEPGDYLILNFVDLYSYTSFELLILLSKMFKKVKVYYSKLLKKNIFIGIYYIHNNEMLVYFKNIYNKLDKNSFIKKFGVEIDKSEEIKIYKFNSFIFNYYKNIYNKIHITELINEKEFLFKHYMKQNGLIKQNLNCNHNLIICNYYNCYICTKCYELFNINY